MLQLCLSQTPNDNPYLFGATGVRVYTFEEMVYHVFHHWREASDEFLSESAAAWVGQIGHEYLAAKMRELAGLAEFHGRVLGFLRLVNYFGEDELAGLREVLDAWEKRREWEKLKERGDFYVNEPGRAIRLYKRALRYEENAALLNNLGVAYLKIGATRESLSCLTRALTLEPANFAMLLHYCEAAVLNGSFDKAAKALEKAFSIDPYHPDIAFLAGLMAYEKKELAVALQWFEKALAADGSVAFYAYKAADVHLQMRQYDKALAAVEKSPARDSAYFEKRAEILAASGDLSHAIKAMSAAIEAAGEAPAAMYAKLAAYHRMNYDTERASEAIAKAVSLDAENNIVRLENARIKKATGQTRRYQVVLNEILTSFKERHRG